MNIKVQTLALALTEKDRAIDALKEERRGMRSEAEKQRAERVAEKELAAAVARVAAEKVASGKSTGTQTSRSSTASTSGSSESRGYVRRKKDAKAGADPRGGSRSTIDPLNDRPIKWWIYCWIY